MSQQFTYVIDEKSLKQKMRNLSSPLMEESWLKFERYAAANERPVIKNPLQNVRITLNREVLMPAAFVVVIIMFSLLLFNFISVKEPKAQVHSPETRVSIPAPAADISGIASGARPKEETRQLQANNEAVKAAAVQVITEPAVSEIAVTPPAETTASATDPGLLSASESSCPRKNTSKRRSADIQGAAFLDEIRPTMVTEDVEPEIRPN